MQNLQPHQTPETNINVPVQKPFFKRFWWLWILFCSMIFLAILFVLLILPKIKKESNKYSSFNENLPTCPSDLSGLFTARVMDKDVLEALTPLGNSNPPGHTFPVDHIYFDGEKDGVGDNVYAPGDGIILQVSEEVGYDKTGTIMRGGVAITIGLCQGVEVIIATPGEVTSAITEAYENNDNDCKTAKGKHEGESKLKVCYYKLQYDVKAGDLIATTDGGEFPEVWALDHNKKLSTDVDWERYESPYYAYAFCFFDLYEGDLKSEYYKLFGRLESKEKLEKPENLKNGVAGPRFVPRTIEPLCGQIIQNINGTAQGDWFGLPKGSSTQPGENTGDLALIHDNIDPTIGKIVTAGNFAKSGILAFIPTHSGKINREFSEVRADGNVYCYQQDSVESMGWWSGGKVLIQLSDDKHLKIEKQNGKCTGSEEFVSSYNYDR